ncbi:MULTISPECIES: hypothetical protein [unclassified Saccharothrix]|uniref:hypothetical protein n=1 Tax=unclassified Saccharothrix TaxID=2593673 RepID=UPI00307D1B12
MTRRTRGSHHTALAINGFLGGAGSLYLLTRSPWATVAITALAVLLALVLTRTSD